MEDPVLEPVTQQFIDALAASGAPAIYTLSPAEARGVLARAQAGPIGKPAARVEDAVFPVGPTGSVRVRSVRPANAEEALPVMMHFHGGGWILGDRNTHDRLVRELAVGAHAAVFLVDYDRAPEARFPVAIEQAYAAMQYVVENAQQLGGDGSRGAIVGGSVGGNMAAAGPLLPKGGARPE